MVPEWQAHQCERACVRPLETKERELDDKERQAAGKAFWERRQGSFYTEPPDDSHFARLGTPLSSS